MLLRALLVVAGLATAGVVATAVVLLLTTTFVLAIGLSLALGSAFVVSATVAATAAVLFAATAVTTTIVVSTTSGRPLVLLLAVVVLVVDLTISAVGLLLMLLFRSLLVFGLFGAGRTGLALTSFIVVTAIVVAPALRVGSFNDFKWRFVSLRLNRCILLSVVCRSWAYLCRWSTSLSRTPGLLLAIFRCVL